MAGAGVLRASAQRAGAKSSVRPCEQARCAAMRAALDQREAGGEAEGDQIPRCEEKEMFDAPRAAEAHHLSCMLPLLFATEFCTNLFSEAANNAIGIALATLVVLLKRLKRV